MRKIEFKIDSKDMEKIKETLEKLPYNTEETINNYLRNEGQKILIYEITSKIPISKKGKRHAKTHKWFQTKFYHLSIVVTTANQYYYLYFVNEGSGTSKKGTYIDFLEDGGEKASKKIAEGLMKKLDENLEIKER